MADPYQMCPCGCGRKVKQCASRAVLHELDNIQQAIEGNQRIAAVQQINRLLSAEGDSTLLLALLGRVQLELGEIDAAKETCDRFGELAPDSPTFKAQKSIFTAQEEGQAQQALDLLLEALEGEHPDMPTLGLSFAMVSQALIVEGNSAAAARLLSNVQMGEGPLQQLRMEAASREQEDPIVLRMARVPQPPPEEHPLAQTLERIDQDMAELRWSAARQQLEKLRGDHPSDPHVLRRIGALLLLRGDDDQAAALWQEIAGLEALDEGERVFAAAAAALATPLGDEWFVDVLHITYPVETLEPVLEKMHDHPCLQSVPAPQASQDGEPPPRAIYQLLNKPVPPESDELSLDSVPEMIGMLLVYGKQTDAPARLKLECHAEALVACESLLRETVEELSESQREVIGSTTMQDVKLSLRLRTPEWATPEQRLALQAAANRRIQMEIWPRTPHPALDGLTPAMAARDKSRKQAVAALVLLQETEKGPVDEFQLSDYLELRKSLGLPHEPLPADEAPEEGLIALDKLTRLPLSQLNDKQLTNALVRCGIVSGRLLSVALEEAVKRPELVKDKRLQLDRLCNEVAEVAQTPPVAVHWLQHAVTIADQAGNSPAEYLIGMLLPALMIGQQEVVQESLQRLTSRHIDEPGVRESLMQFFQTIGIDPATGQPVGGGPGAAPGPGPAPSAAPAKEESGLWTPGSDQGGGGEQGGGGLWLPD